MKKYLLISLLLSISFYPLFGQGRTITGKVVDENNNPLPGANVIVKDTNIGTISDLNGEYSLEVPQGTQFLVFSFIGYPEITKALGVDNVLHVTLIEDATQLGEVVINALGFKQKKDELGSTNSVIDPNAMTRSGETNIINGIAGKAAGVRIARINGDPGAGSNIQIRGANTISGSSQPLIIIDGVPMYNSNLKGSASPKDAGTSQQSRLNDINPEDIASVQVLKGASAAALWGSRAANGVIVITTKEGGLGQKLNISFSSTVSIDEINMKHPLQTTFGQGLNGTYSPIENASWGDKIADRAGGEDQVNKDGHYFIANNGVSYYPIIQKNSKNVYVDDNFNQVFQTGTFFNNSLSISGGGEKAGLLFSISDLRQNGIIKNSNYNRTTLRFNSNYYFNDYISINTKTNYSFVNSNRIQQSSNVNGLYLGLLRNPSDFDISGYKGTYFDKNGLSTNNRQRSYRRYLAESGNPAYNNPLWTVNELKNPNEVHRFIASSEINISPIDVVDITLRGGVDTYSDLRNYYFPTNSAGGDATNGRLMTERYTASQLNFDIIGRTFLKISDDINTNITLGWNINNRLRKKIFAEGKDFINRNTNILNFINFSNANTTVENLINHIRSNRFYYVIGFSLFDNIFVNLSGSLEAASTVKGAFFYPSADVAWVFSSLIPNKSVLSFGKVRTSFGQVGVLPQAYKFQTNYESAEYNAYDDGLNLVNFGGGFRLNDDAGSTNLQPEIKTEFEVGADLRFINDKLGLGFTYYANTVSNILIDVGLPPSVGFNNVYTNAASMENKGIEIELDYTFFQNDDWKLNFYANFNNNKNKVLDLKNTASINITNAGSISGRAIEGYPLGTFWGTKAKRKDGNLNTPIKDSNGNYMNLDLGEPGDVNYGFPKNSGNQGIIGDPNPDWRGGVGLMVSYKNLSLNVLFEHSQGGDFAERTRFILANFGTHADVGNEVTLTEDIKNYEGTLFTAGQTVRGNIENFGAGNVLLDQSYYRTFQGFGDAVINEFAVADATWTRLREVSLSYTLKSQGFREKTKLSSIQFTATGRNLLLWTNIVGIDPEINQSGVDNGFGIDYFTNPSTRSFLFSININY